MKRNTLLSMLESYQPEKGEEEKMYFRTVDFVRAYPDCFERTLEIGHVTASGWVVSEDGGSVLLMHHRKLDQWFQPGGHCDGDPEVEEVARREVMEETGISNLTLLTEGIFDIDIHTIPAGKEMGAHEHFDIRFAFRALPGQEIMINEESRDVQWVPLAQIYLYNNSESIMRMVRKIIA